MPCQQCGRDSYDDQVKESVQMIGTVRLVGNKTTAELYKLQLDDPVVRIILKAKEETIRQVNKRQPKES